MRVSGSLTRPQALPGLQTTGVCHLPPTVPDGKTVKSRAVSGDAEAEYIQAIYHFKGINAPLDWHLANALMKRSADQGYALAEFAYGYFAQTGVGMRMDYGVAQEYYLRASEKGAQGATNALIAIQNDAVWLQRFGRRRRLQAPVQYQTPRRQPDITFGSPMHTKRFAGQYSPLNLPKRLQKTNPLGL
jgi:hypothetical protein